MEIFEARKRRCTAEVCITEARERDKEREKESLQNDVEKLDDARSGRR